MNWIRRCLVVVAALTMAYLAMPSEVDAQDQSRQILRIRKLDSEKVRTPIYRVSNAPQGRTREWLSITTEYDTAPEWVDQLDFQYFVLVKNEKGQQGYTLFRGDVSYVNIERNVGAGPRHKSVVYLHPSTIARYGDVERMAVLIYSEGRLVGMESEPSSSQRWWEQLTPVSGYILNRLESPFAMINFDDYEAIKATSAR